MYFAGKNLLYTFHRSLTAQHITVAAFKRYARSPENRTFRKYFRSTKRFQAQYYGTTDAWLAKMCLRTSSLTCLKAPKPFTKYMRQHPQNAMSRYIAKHRQKKNPILMNFTRHIATTILEKLQTLRIHYPAPAANRTAGILPAGFSSQNNRHRLCPAPAIGPDPRRTDKKTQNKPIYKSVERQRHDGTPCANESTGSSHPVTSVPGFCFCLQTETQVL